MANEIRGDYMLFTQMFNCPHCKGPIEISDTTLTLTNSFIEDAARLRIETIIQHPKFIEEECGVFLQQLAQDLNELRKQHCNKIAMDQILEVQNAEAQERSRVPDSDG